MKEFDFAVTVHSKDGSVFDNETIEKCVIAALKKGEIDNLRVTAAEGNDMRVEVSGKASDVPEFKVGINEEVKIVYPSAKLIYN